MPWPQQENVGRGLALHVIAKGEAVKVPPPVSLSMRHRPAPGRWMWPGGLEPAALSRRRVSSRRPDRYAGFLIHC